MALAINTVSAEQPPRSVDRGGFFRLKRGRRGSLRGYCVGFHFDERFLANKFGTHERVGRLDVAETLAMYA